MTVMNAVPESKPKRCPTCGQPTAAEARPFCSVRCKDVDLGRWLSGAYVIEGGRTDEDADAGAVGVSLDDTDVDTEPR